MPDLSPLPSIFSFYRSIDQAVSIAALQSQVGLTHKWPQWLRANKRDERTALRQSVLQVGEPDFINWSLETLFVYAETLFVFFTGKYHRRFSPCLRTVLTC